MEQGKYALGEDITASEAIVMAGGFTEIASRNGVKVIRKLDSGKNKIMKVPVGDIFKGAREDKDVLLQDGDVVVVPESWF